MILCANSPPPPCTPVVVHSMIWSSLSTSSLNTPVDYPPAHVLVPGRRTISAVSTSPATSRSDIERMVEYCGCRGTLKALLPVLLREASSGEPLSAPKIVAQSVFLPVGPDFLAPSVGANTWRHGVDQRDSAPICRPVYRADDISSDYEPQVSIHLHQ